MLATQIKGILEDKALVWPTNGSMTLRETNVMDVEVAEVPSSVTVIDMRKMGSLSGVRDGECRQTCDYLLVWEVEGRDVAIFVELKKTLDLNRKKSGMEQLRRSLPLLDYLCSVCRIHHGLKSYKSVAARYFLIGEKGGEKLDKQPVRPGRALTTETYKGITVHTFVGSMVRFDLLRSAS